MTRRSLVAAIAAFLVIGTASTGSALPRSGSPASFAGFPSVTTVSGAAGHDFATDAFADPWDYSNQEDLLLDPGPTMRASKLTYGFGRVSTFFTGNGYISPIWGGYGGSSDLESAQIGEP